METEKIFELIKGKYKNGLMIDVGAFDGGTFKPFFLIIGMFMHLNQTQI